MYPNHPLGESRKYLIVPSDDMHPSRSSGASSKRIIPDGTVGSRCSDFGTPFVLAWITICRGLRGANCRRNERTSDRLRRALRGRRDTTPTSFTITGKTIKGSGWETGREGFIGLEARQRLRARRGPTPRAVNQTRPNGPAVRSHAGEHRRPFPPSAAGSCDSMVNGS